jgi:hypothetical protein
VGLTPDEYEEQLDKSRKAKPEERWVLEGEELDRLENEGTIVRNVGGAPVRINVTSPRERNEPGAWRWEPADLAMSFADLKNQYDSKTFGMWEAWARQAQFDGMTVWDWTKRALGVTPPVVAPAVAAPGLIQGARTFKAVKKAMTELVREYDTAAVEIEAAKVALTSTPWSDPSYQAKVDQLMRARQKLEEIKEKGRKVASVPVAQRGKVQLEQDARTLQVLPQIMNYSQGAEIAERYTAAKYLPKVSLDFTPDGRAYYDKGKLALTPTKEARVVAHEITHGTEIQFGLVEKSAAFLRSRRRKKEVPKSLQKLLGSGYSDSEIVIEDDFAKKGSSHYAGKLYFPGVSSKPWRDAWTAKMKSNDEAAFSELYATELLTMGIERVHDDPVGFAKADPKYFQFVIKTLQDV